MLENIWTDYLKEQLADQLRGYNSPDPVYPSLPDKWISACCPGVTRKVQRTQLGCEFVVYNHLSNIVGGDKRYDESDVWYANVQAMKSKDFDNVYFIAVDAIYKPVHAFIGRAV